MKKLRIGVSLVLILVMLVYNSGVQVWAKSGEQDYTAIALTPGKAKVAKMQKGKGGVYFKVASDEMAKLKVNVEAEKFGTNMKLEVYKLAQEWSFWNETATFKYNKSKKKVVGTLTSEYVLNKGVYIIKLAPEKELRSAKKVKITAKLVDTGYDDIESNSSESDAQSMDVKGKKTYKMLLSKVDVLYDIDNMDCFKFKLKKTQKFNLKVSLDQPVDELYVLVCKDQPDGIVTLKKYDMKKKKLDETLKLDSGTYFIKIWYNGSSNIQIPYKISGTVK